MSHYLHQHITGKHPVRVKVVDEVDRVNGAVIGQLKIKEFGLATFPNGLIQMMRVALGRMNFVKGGGNIPPYFLTSMSGVKIHLLDDIKPDENGGVFGQIEVNVRVCTTNREGGVENAHLSIDVVRPNHPTKPELPTVVRFWNSHSPTDIPTFSFDYRFGPDSKGGNVFVIL